MATVQLKYNDYELEVAATEQEESQSSGKDFLQVKEGKNLLRILPPTGGERSPFRVTYQHYINVPGNSKSQSIVCARLEAKKPCKVCDMVERLRASQSKADQAAANDLFVRRRVYANVIDRDDEEHGPKVFAFGKTVHEQLLTLRTDSKGGGDFCHPTEGFDIILKRKGTSKNNTEYTVFPDRNTSPLGPSVEVMQEWIDTQHSLGKYAALPDAEKLAGLLPEGDDEDEEEAAPVRRPPPRSATTTTRAAPARTTTTRTPAKRTAEDDAIDVDAEED